MPRTNFRILEEKCPNCLSKLVQFTEESIDPNESAHEDINYEVVECSRKECGYQKRVPPSEGDCCI